MDNITHEMRLAQWTSIIRECNNSGMSKKSWMSANDIDEKQFYYWQRRVREEVIQELRPTFSSATTFVELPAPVSAVPLGKQPDAIIHMGNCSLEIHNTISPALLQTMIQAVTHAE